eukprot:EG_transcript_16754
MACQVFCWLERTIGLDITGESDFQKQKTALSTKKGDESKLTSPPKKRSEAATSNPSVDIMSPRKSRSCQRLSTKPAEALTIEPPSLYFPTPLDRFIHNTLTLTNVSAAFVIYKVKGSAADHYVVKHRQGVIGPHENREVRITLKPTDADPRKLHHKFLVQFRALSLDEVSAFLASGDFQALWQHGASALEGRKIRCHFVSELPKGFVTRYVVDGDDASPRGPPPPLSDDEDLGVAQPELPTPTVLQRRRNTYTFSGLD